VITLHLLHPIDSTPVQSWQFSQEILISIGRSSNNDVVLLSSVVSRHHVDLSRQQMGWIVMSRGANGTYLNGEIVDKIEAINGMIIRLASTGPKMQICFDPSELEAFSQAEIDLKVQQKIQAKAEIAKKERMTVITSSNSE
jgi:pSer/pThr/pTyr-binding forkhead associated (FHA) protein